RPYKDAWPVEEAVALIVGERGAHFDPQVVDAFMAGMETILTIKQSICD
ncbi:MAG: two-component system response regulator, partial [Magnetococcales bacterium]|nr:two-component system response regulator [Magnetococcales bacterium]